MNIQKFTNYLVIGLGVLGAIFLALILAQGDDTIEMNAMQGDFGYVSYIILLAQIVLAIAVAISLGFSIKNLVSDKNKLTQRSELEAACDAILWGTGTGAKINADRDQDASATGDLCDVFTQFALGDFSNLPFTLSDIDRVTLITDTCTLKKFRELKYGTLSHYFKAGSKVFAGVYSAMQCMLKGVCSQCLQWQVDPITGKRSKAVYACSWQHQPIEMIDIDNIDDRLSQNMMQDTVNNHWLDYLFETKDVKRL